MIQSLGVARVQECEYGRGMVTFGVSVCVCGGGGGGAGGCGCVCVKERQRDQWGGG